MTPAMNPLKLILILLVVAAFFCQAGSLKSLLMDKMLDEAYRDHSAEKLWKVMIAVTQAQAQDSITKEQLARKPEFEQHVYALFTEFYKGENIFRFWKEVYKGDADKAMKRSHLFVALPTTRTRRRTRRIFFGCGSAAPSSPDVKTSSRCPALQRPRDRRRKIKK